MQRKVFKVEGMHCAGCATMLEMDFEDAGFKASCSYIKQTLVIEFDESNKSEGKIKEILKQTEYKLLPFDS